ncbi:MAG: glucose-1-phosphate cytidylyltransferase [SAR86 cluster bacterium]|nr:glucose-1-phosphate cytidylyltransferase [SAR86 cluster bacterium]
MKTVLLAGGLGTRISEETDLKPKPMVEIGGKPILWHIMKLYHFHGVNEFIICCGYKGDIIKEYFSNYFLHGSDITFDLSNNSFEVHQEYSEPWKVTCVDTGQDSMTGGRLKRVEKYLDDDEPFCMTYGDGLSNINIKELIKFHQNKGLKATLTAAIPPSRFGALTLKDGKVKTFEEKPISGQGKVNGGFFVLSKEVISLINDDQTIWEREPLEKLANEGELGAFDYDGFWQPMDTLRDKKYLQALWDSGDAPWKVW